MSTISTQTPPSSSSRSRSILERIRSPFAAKSRNISDFFIEPSDPRRQYAPGDTIKGHVSLTVHKPTRVTHIVLGFHGFVKLYKNVVPSGRGTPSEVTTPAPGRGLRGPEYHGNGLMSLFDDEIVICGEGRLNPGRYSFDFEIAFPSRYLPTSLDFERGTISYLLTATLTRPTSIAPTMTCEKKLQLVEAVDVASLKAPDPIVIKMAPLVKRNKSRTRARMTSNESVLRAPPEQDQSNPNPRGSVPQEELPDSPSVSEFSVLSTDTSSLSFRVTSVGGPGNLGGEPRSEEGTSSDKIITAKVELRRGGYLPGDSIPVRVTIRHNRNIRSMQGIIVTLYRKARIKPYPLTNKGSSGKDKEAARSNYSKPKLGISGLSLSSPSSHTFRMELDQTFAPMVIHPSTLEAEIKTELRIPEEVFPTIASIPGNMVAFTYHVEVIVDLCAKLAAQGRIMSRMTMTRSPSSVVLGQTRNLHAGLDANHFMDTLEVRRDKSIGNCTFEVVIGTKDSSRKTVRRPPDPWEEAERAARQSPESPGDDRPSRMGTLQAEEDPSENLEEAGMTLDALSGSRDAETPALIIPPLQKEDDVDEKTRLRRMEERLLPSAPPVDDHASSSSSTVTARVQPSAPILDDDEDDDDDNEELYNSINATPAYERPPELSSETIVPRSPGGDQSATEATNETASTLDDKQELERQRLLAAVSSPDDHNESVVSEAGPSLPVPTAPAFDEDDEYYGPSAHDTFSDNTGAPNSAGRWVETERPPRYQH